jgi:1-acyl-sn-glycerol-3-phosphate acyltransferase
MNPFINKTLNLTANGWHRVSMTVAAITIFPVRVLLTLLNCLVAIGAAYAGFSRMLSWQVRFQLVLFGFWWVEVTGTPASRAIAPIVVSNHMSLIEAAWLQFHTKAVTLSAIENSTRPVLGTMLNAMGTLWVTRATSGNSSGGGVTAAITEIATAATGPRVLIFPEGTCGNGQALATFRSGAFVAGVSVQPVAVRYRFDRFDPSWCTVGPNLNCLLMRMFLSWYNVMEVTYLPVMSMYEHETPQQYCTRVRDAIAAVLHVPVTQFSFDDILLGKAAGIAGADPGIGLVELTAMGIKSDTALQKLHAYIKEVGAKNATLRGFKERLQIAI